MSSLLFFFFQAEDGIRDTSVTGVQTCALPILRSAAPATMIGLRPKDTKLRAATIDATGHPNSMVVSMNPATSGVRSEERRVGKEGRGGGWRALESKRGLERRERARRERSTNTS